MGARLTLSPTDALTSQVLELREELNALKEAQIIGGSSLAIRDNVTANPVDLSFSMTGSFPQTTALVKVAFTPEKNGDAYAELTVEAYRDSPTNKIDLIVYDDPATALLTDRTGWAIYIDSFDTIINGAHDFVNAAHTYYFKFHVKCVEGGTITSSVTIS